MEILLGKSYGEWIERVRPETLRSDTPLIQRNENWKVIYMKETHRITEAVFDEHPASIAGAQFGGCRALVGEQDGGFVAPQVQDEELAKAPSAQGDGPLIHARGLVLAAGHIQFDSPPSRT